MESWHGTDLVGRERENQVSRGRIAGKEDTVVGHIRSESFGALGDKEMCAGVTAMRGGHTRCLL